MVKECMMIFSHTVTQSLMGVTVLGLGLLSLLAPKSTDIRHKPSVHFQQNRSAANNAARPASAQGKDELNLQQKMELLQQGHDFLQTIPAYTAKFRKQEVVG